MMMTQQYYGAGPDFDPYNRAALHRSLSSTGYYDRQTPYTYYDQPRHDLRSDYGNRSITRLIDQGPELEVVNGQTRRRVGVACSRCRKRKIKCSGKPEEGKGCHACRSSGADISNCNFDRIASNLVKWRSDDVDPLPQSVSTPVTQATSYSEHSWPPTNYGTTTAHQPLSRPSLPILHTRSSFMENYDNVYDSSPVDAYTYASSTIPRQDSIASKNSYGTGIDSYRAWNGPASAPVASTYYEQPQPAYSFGTMQAPSYPSNSNRLPSVTADSFSSLSMHSLHSSLPTQTAQERRLPIPCAPTYPPTPHHLSNAGLPEIRPLGSFTEPRVHINGIHSRNALLWSPQSMSAPQRIAPVNSMARLHGLPALHIQPVSNASASEPVLGYQFNGPNGLPVSTGSPDVSPPTGTVDSGSFSSAASSSSSTTSNHHNSSASFNNMPPPPAIRYSTCSRSSNHGTSTHNLPALQYLAPDQQQQRPPTASSRDIPHPSLYSYSSDTGEQQLSSTCRDTTPVHHNCTARTPPTPTTVLRHPQPQHHASVEALRRQSSFDQEHRAATVQRMSMSNLNARY